MPTDQTPQKISKGQFSSLFTYRSMLPLFIGIFAGVLVTTAYFLAIAPATNDDCVSFNWKANECPEMPGNERDGLRIGDDGPASGDEIRTLMTRYEDKYKATTTPEGSESVFINGGNLHRCVLLSILKSMNPGDDYVPYVFGMDGERTVIIVQGGLINPTSGRTMGQPLTFRTGTNEECFCPSHCSIY